MVVAAALLGSRNLNPLRKVWRVVNIIELRQKTFVNDDLLRLYAYSLEIPNDQWLPKLGAEEWSRRALAAARRIVAETERRATS